MSDKTKSDDKFANIPKRVMSKIYHHKSIEVEIRIIDSMDENMVKGNPTIEQWVRQGEDQKGPIDIQLSGVWVTGVSQEPTFDDGIQRYVTDIRLVVMGIDCKER